MYEDKTYELIKKGILDRINSPLDKREGSFTNNIVSPMSLEFEGAYGQLEALLGVMFLTELDSDQLEERAKEYGIFKKLATEATCSSVIFTGVLRTVIPKGTLVATVTNVMYETTEEAILLTESAKVNVKAVQAGVNGNTPINTIIKLPVSVVGITSVTNTTEAVGGTDTETAEALLKRLLYKIQNPSTGGNIVDLKNWATEINGVGDAKPIPLANGPGTATVLVISPVKRVVSQDILDKVKANIDSKRTVCGGIITVMSPTEIVVNTSTSLRISQLYSIVDIKAQYTEKVKKYIEDSVFKLKNVDYYKCLSFWYEIEGVIEVVDFKINNGATSIPIDDMSIQVLGYITTVLL